MGLEHVELVEAVKVLPVVALVGCGDDRPEEDEVVPDREAGIKVGEARRGGRDRQ